MMISVLVSQAVATPGCHTPTMHRARLLRGSSDYERPGSNGFVDSERFPIRVHHRRAADADRVVAVVLPAVERAWEVQIERIGWPAPPADDGEGGSDAFDVYLTDAYTYGGAYVYGDGPDVVPGDDWFTVPTYMALDETILDEELPSFVAHELNHASQYAIDAWEWSTFVWEATAEVMADIVDDDDNTYIAYGGIEDFQAFPFLSLGFDGYHPAVSELDPYSLYEYGGIVFGMFLEEHYGRNDGTALLALWDALAQPTAELEPDFVDALAIFEPHASTPVARVYARFAEWRMFAAELDDGAHFEEASLWGRDTVVGTERTLPLEELADGGVSLRARPFALGTSYTRVDLPADVEGSLLVEVTGDEDVQWGLAWAVWPATGPARTDVVLVDDDAPGASIPLEGGAQVMVGVINVGGAGFDPDVGVERSGFELVLSWSEAGGSADPGPMPDRRRCGCASGGAAAPLLWGLGVWFASFRRGSPRSSRMLRPGAVE